MLVMSEKIGGTLAVGCAWLSLPEGGGGGAISWIIQSLFKYQYPCVHEISKRIKFKIILKRLAICYYCLRF